jgi:hypothetical protein
MPRLTLLGLIVALWGAGCTCYHVTDTRTGRTFYTKDVEELEGGAIAFVDMRSGSRVTVEAPQVEEIRCDSARRALYQDEKRRSKVGLGTP